MLAPVALHGPRSVPIPGALSHSHWVEMFLLIQRHTLSLGLAVCVLAKPPPEMTEHLVSYDPNWACLVVS